jgi:hypothetical protein
MEGWKVTEDSLIEDDDCGSGLNALSATSDLAARDHILESLVNDYE